MKTIEEQKQFVIDQVQKATSSFLIDNIPKCPKCKSSDQVRYLTCKCSSCPPWICFNCTIDNNSESKGYEFYDEEEE
jgi:hypothetical protein